MRRPAGERMRGVRRRVCAGVRTWGARWGALGRARGVRWGRRGVAAGFQAGSKCSSSSCTLLTPLYSLIPSLYAAWIWAAAPSAWLKRIAW